jgi:photosystem II stability/assembly factor-like uncharacterized protein
MKRLFGLAFLLNSLMATAQFQLSIDTLSPSSSFRGLSLAPDGSLWVCGSKGAVYRKASKSTEWQSISPDRLDFRSIHAFDSLNALVASAGSPARIYRTLDGGKSWSLSYELNDSLAFLDALCFCTDKVGYALGDPVDGRLFLLKSINSGKSWQRVSHKQMPDMKAGEAFFAASGTSMECYETGLIRMVSGGMVSRLFEIKDGAKNWSLSSLPMLQGKASRGAFSLAFKNKMQGIVVGGDYLQDTLRQDHVWLTFDGGKNWRQPTSSTGGYRECVQWLDNENAFAIGPGGLDWTQDGGKTWQPVAGVPSGLHVLKAQPNGQGLYLAGNKGLVIYLSLP